MRKPFLSLTLGTFVSLAASREAVAQTPQPGHVSERIVMSDVLVINRLGGAPGRVPLAVDALQRTFVCGQWKSPKAGDTVALATGATRPWSEAKAGEDGTLNADGMRGGYALWTVQSDAEKIMLLQARGHGMVYVNGEPRMGDPYSNGSVTLPVKLRKGTNELLFHCSRGAIKAELTAIDAPVSLSAADLTLPDLVRGDAAEQWGAVVVVNVTEQPFKPLAIQCEHSGVMAATDDAATVPPMSVRKVAFRIPAASGTLGADAGKVRATITMLGASVGKSAQLFAPLEVDFNVVDANALQRRTFISAIDGSVQYYAARPALKPDAGNGLILTLHGASVEASGQAAAYQSKDWATIIAATNRRPFGFDWEDWGRLDGMEVLDIARREFQHDPNRVYLTGHSMGGHGTWQLGVTFPGEFAAIAPSAGWISFESYSNLRPTTRPDERPDPLDLLMKRAANASRTLELQRNLEGVGVYILHGEKDDNVPVDEARTMRMQLSPWHKDLAYHEQPGAGHWWGNECVDWPPLIEFLQQHSKPAGPDRVQFITASPGVSASRDWATIQQQARAFEFSRVDLKRDVAARTIVGTTANVARLALDVSAFGEGGGGEIEVNLDGQVVRARARPPAAIVELSFDGTTWQTAPAPLASSHKTPARCGPFKAAFNHQFILVYGTKGTPEENAWAFAKARYDAEQFWYRGNGSIDVIADSDFNARDAKHKDRSVILYGNADTNAAWNDLLGDSPVRLSRDAIVLGSREIAGDHFACLFVRPRPGSDVACVGVVGGTGLVGCRLTDRLPYFTSGVAYPDCTIFDAGEAVNIGARQPAIIGAGFFGNDWSIEGGEFAFRE